MIRVELVSSSIQEICYSYHRRHVMRKPAFLHIQKANAQMNCKVSEFMFWCFYFLYPKLTSSVAVQPGWCRTWSETTNTGFSHEVAHLIPVCNHFRLASHEAELRIQYANMSVQYTSLLYTQKIVPFKLHW